jgi:hypothetical protein
VRYGERSGPSPSSSPSEEPHRYPLDEVDLGVVQNDLEARAAWPRAKAIALEMTQALSERRVTLFA